MLQKGFTLIELMIVVAIIGILSMFALPAYQDYTKRTYVSEGMTLASAAKTGVTEQFVTSNTWVSTNAAAGVGAGATITGQAVTGVFVATGTAGRSDNALPTGATAVTGAASNIVIYYNAKVTSNDADNAAPTAPANLNTAPANAIILAPVVYTFAAGESQGSIPWVCRANGTRVLEKWLPATCRAQVAVQAGS